MTNQELICGEIYNKMNEGIWKDIDGYDGVYKINKIGEVLSMPRRGAWTIPKKRRSHTNTSGYPEVGLCKNYINKKHSIHRLVAIAFIPNPENKPEVNHINGIKSDYRIENLEWVTASENVLHSFKIGISKRERGHLSKRAKPILQILPNGEKIYWGSIINAAKALGIHDGSICCALKGRRNIKRAGGFSWEYADKKTSSI